MTLSSPEGSWIGTAACRGCGNTRSGEKTAPESPIFTHLLRKRGRVPKLGVGGQAAGARTGAAAP